MSTKKNNGPSAESETIDKLKSAINALAMIIKDHIPNANLTPVLSSLNVEGRKDVRVTDFSNLVDIAV
ncbi:hypothetical protein R6Q57_014792 [Mikania cordata]